MDKEKYKNLNIRVDMDTYFRFQKLKAVFKTEQNLEAFKKILDIAEKQIKEK